MKNLDHIFTKNRDKKFLDEQVIHQLDLAVKNFAEVGS
jgi:hypothetical protein